MSVTYTNYYKKLLLDGGIDHANDTLKVMLLNSSHTTDIDAQQFADDISANELSTSGSYTSGFGNRITLTATTSQDNTDNEGVFDFSNFNITSFTGSVRYIAVIKEVTADSDSPILGIEDLGTDYSATNGTWAYTTNTEGFTNVV